MIKVFIQQSLENFGINIYIVDVDPASGGQRVARPVRLEFGPPVDAEVVDPTLRLPGVQGRQFLQELAVALVDSGYRDKTSSSAGEITRLVDHLSDLRKLVFDPRAKRSGFPVPDSSGEV